jgi:hypothetical protein
MFLGPKFSRSSGSYEGIGIVPSCVYFRTSDLGNLAAE